MSSAAPAAYWKSFDYDAAGNRTKEVEHGSDGDTTRTYSYPEVGEPRPHAVTSVAENGPAGEAANEYGYDRSGNTTNRNLAGKEQDLTWDAEGLLTRVTEGRFETSFVYDADGNRLIRDDPVATNLYLPDGMELRLSKSTARTVTATRYYTHADQVVAMRTPHKLSYQVSDHQGTTGNQIDADSLALDQRRLLPFGKPRGEDPQDWLGEKGFVGGTTDTSTGLTHLGAREYDPDIGRFISVDPLMDPANPRKLDAFGYAGNSPVTASDPDGEDYCDLHPCPGDKEYEEKKKKNKRKVGEGIGKQDAADEVIDRVANSLPAKHRKKFKEIAWKKFFTNAPKGEDSLKWWINKAIAAALAACSAIGDEICAAVLMDKILLARNGAMPSS